MENTPEKKAEADKCQKLWQEFIEKVKAEGFSLVLLPVIKQALVDGMNQREKNLVTVIANTYLDGAITFAPLQPEKPSDALLKPDDSLKK